MSIDRGLDKDVYMYTYIFTTEYYSASLVDFVVQSLSHIRLFVIPWIAARQASQSFTISWNLLTLKSIELVIPSNHFIPFVPFSSCPQSCPASGSFPVNWLFASGGQTIRASALVSVFPMNIQGLYPLGLTGLISVTRQGGDLHTRVNSLDLSVRLHYAIRRL